LLSQESGQVQAKWEAMPQGNIKKLFVANLIHFIVSAQKRSIQIRKAEKNIFWQAGLGYDIKTN
jgi:hypothetical protein